LNREEFFQKAVEKSGSTLKGIASLITQSFEVESMTTKNAQTIKARLREVKGGSASNKQINDGNGWNDDCHHDGSLTSYSDDNGGCYGTETSASPIDLLSFPDIKLYLDNILATYLEVSGGVYHTRYGSTHVHNTVAYLNADNGFCKSIEVDHNLVYANIALFLVKFMPALKWLCMTDKAGGRRVRGTGYDLMNNDELFGWFEWYGLREDTSITSDSSINNIMGMGRDSYMRVLGTRSRGNIHWENRMCDTTFNSTHLAMWLSINKAITLFAIDFARKNYTLPLSRDEWRHSKSLMMRHTCGYKELDRQDIEKMYKEMVSYLAKYLKVTGSLDAIEVMDKLIKCPISQWVDENGYDYHWNTQLIERVFNTRNRASDDELRNKFIQAIQLLQVQHAESLNDFQENMAIHLNVEVKKIKSLYQMFKRENVDIEFLGGRLVYLGD
jgi:hypothetical protein